jgi:hypothetical protein
MFEKTLTSQTIPPHDTPVVAYGVVDRSFDGSMLRFTLNRMIPLEEIRQARVKSLVLKIDQASELAHPANISENVAKLRKLVAARPGPTPIRLHLVLKNTEVIIDPSANTGVELTDHLLFEIKKLPFRRISTHCNWATATDD